MNSDDPRFDDPEVESHGIYASEDEGPEYCADEDERFGNREDAQ